MSETTVYLPDDLERKLEAAAADKGVSLVLESSGKLPKRRSLPVFDSGRALSADEMDQAIYEHISERTDQR